MDSHTISVFTIKGNRTAKLLQTLDSRVEIPAELAHWHVIIFLTSCTWISLHYKTSLYGN